MRLFPSHVALLCMVMVFCLKFFHNHPHFLFSVHMPFCLIQIPLFPHYSRELPAFFPLPRSSRCSVGLLAREKCSQSFWSRKQKPLSFDQPELEKRALGASPLHSRLQITLFRWNFQLFARSWLKYNMRKSLIAFLKAAAIAKIQGFLSQLQKEKSYSRKMVISIPL